MYVFHSSVLFIICMGSYVQFYQKNFLRLFFPKAVTRRLSFALLRAVMRMCTCSQKVEPSRIYRELTPLSKINIK